MLRVRIPSFTLGDRMKKENPSFIDTVGLKLYFQENRTCENVRMAIRPEADYGDEDFTSSKEADLMRINYLKKGE